MNRIVIFSMAYYPHVGGAEVAIKEITDRIAQGDISFDLVTLRFSPADAKQERIGNVVVHRIGGGSGKFWKFYYQFAAAFKGLSLHREKQFDALWAMMAHSAGVPAAIFSILRPSVPYVLTLQEGDPFSHIERTMLPLWPLFVQSFRRAKMVQPISHYLAQWARTRGFAGPIEVIPNGVDAQRFAGESVAHEGITLITSSRLVHKNAVDDIICALKILPTTIRLRILGSGPDEASLRALAVRLGVENRVEFVGFVDNSELPKHLHAADIFIRPSRSEGMGISFIEAMAAGLPVIATQEGGIVDFLFDAKRNPKSPTTGWAVDKDSPLQIAEAVEEILRNQAQSARVIKNAYEMVQSKYDWDLLAQKMRTKVFSRVL